MLLHHKRNWNGFPWLTWCLLAVCVGTGCSTLLLGKGPEDEKTWTCDPAADEAMKTHDYETGLLLHERFLEKNPSNALALYHIGYANGRMGDHQKEVIFYEKAIALGLKDDRIFYNLGMAYGELNQIENSIGAFKEALAMNPDNSDNHFGLAMAYYQSGTSDKAAEAEFLKVIQMDPANLDARLYLSMLYSDMGEMQKATEQLQEILAVDPTYSRAIEFLKRIENE